MTHSDTPVAPTVDLGEVWTVVGGITSSVTALAAVIGIVLAVWAVKISKQSTVIAGRNYLDEQFGVTMSEVVRFGVVADLLTDKIPEDTRSDPRELPEVRAGLGELAVGLNSAKLGIRRFRATGLPKLDAVKRKSAGDLTLDVALNALEVAIDSRYTAIDWDSSSPERRELLGAEFPASESASTLLAETIDYLNSNFPYRDRRDRNPVVLDAFEDALAPMWLWSSNSSAQPTRSDVTRLLFDIVVDLVQECHAIATHTNAPWAKDVPAPDRDFTCRCGTSDADHSSGHCKRR